MKWAKLVVVIYQISLDENLISIKKIMKYNWKKNTNRLKIFGFKFGVKLELVITKVFSSKFDVDIFNKLT